MPLIVRSVDRFVVFVFLSIFAGVFWPPNEYFFKEAVRAGPSNIYDFTAFSILIPFLAVAFFLSRVEVARLLRVAWPVLLLCGLAFVSAVWADDPQLVIRRSGTLTATALFGIYLIARSDFGSMIGTLVKVYALAMLISLVLVTVAPQLGTTTTGEMYVHSWRGVFTDKNELGMACAIGILLSVYALAKGLGPRSISGFTLVASAALLAGAQSKTPVVMLAAALYAGLLGSALRRRSGRGLALSFLLIVVGLALAGMLLLGWQDLLAALGRDATLTNRTKIWHYALVFIAHRPWLGYGFGGFWRLDGLEANQFWVLVEFATPHAHNAWLELGLDLGIVGIAAAALTWSATLYRAVRGVTLPPAQHAAFCLALLAGIFVENITEYEFMRQGHILWALFAAASAYLGMQLSDWHHRGLARAAPPPLAAAALGAYAARGVPIKP